MKGFFLFMCIYFSVSFIGCSLLGGIPWGKSRVSFVLPEVTDTNSANELIYINLISNNPVLRHNIPTGISQTITLWVILVIQY